MFSNVHDDNSIHQRWSKVLALVLPLFLILISTETFCGARTVVASRAADKIHAVACVVTLLHYLIACTQAQQEHGQTSKVKYQCNRMPYKVTKCERCYNRATKLTPLLVEGFEIIFGSDPLGNGAVAIVHEGAEKLDDVASVVKSSQPLIVCTQIQQKQSKHRRTSEVK